jgi:hypothetical protein
VAMGARRIDQLEETKNLVAMSRYQLQGANCEDGCD